MRSTLLGEAEARARLSDMSEEGDMEVNFGKGVGDSEMSEINATGSGQEVLSTACLEHCMHVFLPN